MDRLTAVWYSTHTATPVNAMPNCRQMVPTIMSRPARHAQPTTKLLS